MSQSISVFCYSCVFVIFFVPLRYIRFFVGNLPIDGKHEEKHTGNFHDSIQEKIQVHIAAHCPGSQKDTVICQTVHEPSFKDNASLNKPL